MDALPPRSLPLPLSWASVPALSLGGREVAPMVSAGPQGHGGTTNGSDIIQSMRTANKAYAPMTHQFLEWAKESWEGSHNQYNPLTFNLGIHGGEENTLFLQNKQFIYNLEQGFSTSLIPDMLIVLCHGFVLRCQHAPPSCNNQMSPDIAQIPKRWNCPSWESLI